MFAISNHKAAHFFQLQMNVADVIGQLVFGTGERGQGIATLRMTALEMNQGDFRCTFFTCVRSESWPFF